MGPAASSAAACAGTRYRGAPAERERQVRATPFKDARLRGAARSIAVRARSGGDDVQTSARLAVFALKTLDGVGSSHPGALVRVAEYVDAFERALVAKK